MARYLALARHGQSEYNAQNRFTGWHDSPLTDRGVQEALEIARRIRGAGLSVDVAFSSTLARARRTAEIVLTDLGQPDVPVVADMALNERDYGELSGLDKDQARERWGDAQIHRWRRGYSDVPPGGESLRDTAARALRFYIQHILPAVMREETALVVAHGNSLRALVMALDGLSPETIERVEIATGELLVYELESDTTVLSRSQVT